MTKTKKPLWAKLLIGLGIVVGAIVALVLLVLLSVHLITPLLFNDFFGEADKEYLTPGLSEGLVPQGYDYIAEKELFLMCGYMTDGVSAGRIYVTDPENAKESRYVELYTADGQPYTGHTGGITHKGNYLWLANDGQDDDNCVWVMDLNEVLNAASGGKITLDKYFKPETRSAFCYADENYLWVGEFRDPEKYLTVESHHFEVSGGTNYALVCAYPLDLNAEHGIMVNVEGEPYIPDLCLSLTDLVQGFTRTEDGGFVLSTSYSVKKSHLLFYSDVTKGEPDTIISIGETAVPVYFLDADVLTRDVEMPPMSEEIVVIDGDVYVLFESACKKYIFGNFTRGRHVYSYEIN